MDSRSGEATSRAGADLVASPDRPYLPPADRAAGDRHISRPGRGRRWPWLAIHPSISRAGASACVTPSSQPRQAFFRNCGGTRSSRSLLSSPIRCNSPWQQGQILLSMSMTTSIRGRRAGKAPRLPRRLRARTSRPSGALTSCAVSLYAGTCSTSSRPVPHAQAANCAADRRTTPSSIFGQRNILKPLGEQTQTRSVPEHQLDPIRRLARNT